MRKGITPIIAVVLMILITVAMIGVLYTQVEELMEIGDDQLDFMEDVDANINSVIREDHEDEDFDTMNVRIESNEEGPLYLVEDSSEAVLRIEYSRGGASSLEGDTFVQSYLGDDVDFVGTEEGWTHDWSGCDIEEFDEQVTLENEGEEDEEITELYLTENDRVTCDTGVPMPNAGESTTVHLVEQGSGDDADDYSCSISTGDEPAC